MTAASVVVPGDRPGGAACLQAAAIQRVGQHQWAAVDVPALLVLKRLVPDVHVPHLGLAVVVVGDDDRLPAQLRAPDAELGEIQRDLIRAGRGEL